MTNFTDRTNHHDMLYSKTAMLILMMTNQNFNMDELGPAQPQLYLNLSIEHIALLTWLSI